MSGIKKNVQRMGVRVACSKGQQEATTCLMVGKLWFVFLRHLLVVR